MEQMLDTLALIVKPELTFGLGVLVVDIKAKPGSEEERLDAIVRNGLAEIETVDVDFETISGVSSVVGCCSVSVPSGI